jgi:DMSO reductase iron-sulfur subunit
LGLPLHQRALESDSEDLVRLTLIEGGASPQLVNALIPQRPLAPGEQYRFHFDMTKCIGCRSCEVACNEQNGNPADIKWRRIGELEGGTYPDTQRTYLSMGCNHCLDADCLKGCPVDAYKKDPVTGIVLHSAEACIGCQYCVWNCPYSVPQFNPERGVVGKCDMCRGRLEEGLEPACVHACPEDAIQIEIVNKAEWRDNYASADSPGMPPAAQTISTTRITLPEKSEGWLERVDTGHIRPEHAHPSLVVMTTAVQATFGTLGALVFTRTLDTVTVTVLALLTAIALNVSVFHLGRPAYAWRALKMWRRSWLSREVLLFGLFFAAIGLCMVCSWSATLGFLPLARLVTMTAIAASVFGFFGMIASACIYLVHARPAWNTIHTPADFLLSSALIGSVMPPVLDRIAAPIAASFEHFGVHLSHSSHGTPASPVAILALLWILNQSIRLLRLRQSKLFEARASYNLLRSPRFRWIVVLSLIAAAAAPAFLALHTAGLYGPSLALVAAILAVASGRYLFFVSVVPLSMGLTYVRARHAWV